MKTTKKQFTLFKREVKSNIKLYGLVDWDVVIVHEQAGTRTISTTVPELESRIVVFTLNTNIASEPITDEELKEIAVHEVLELLFTKLEDMVCKSAKTAAREEVHALIQTFININRSSGDSRIAIWSLSGLGGR